MSALLQEEIDDFDPEIAKSKRETILEKLREKSLLNYGVLIKQHDVEEIFNIKYNVRDQKEWDLTLLNLRGILQKEGFFVTSRGKDNDLYVLKPQEMAHFNEKKNRSAYENLRGRQKGLYLIDDNLFTIEEQKKLEFEILRNGHLQLEMAKKLKERCR